jgi:hypothetical protein
VANRRRKSWGVKRCWLKAGCSWATLAQTQPRVGRQASRGGVPQIVQRPVRAQLGVGPLQDPPHGPVAQRPRLAPQRAPHRLPWHRDTVLVEIARQVAEGVWRGRQRIQRAAALRDYPDPLVGPIHLLGLQPQQLAGTRAAGDIEGQQCPVPVSAHRLEQLIPQRVRDRSRGVLGEFLPQRRAASGRLRLQWAAVRQPPTPLRRSRDRIDQRAAAEATVEGVEGRQDRQGVVDRRGGIAGWQRRLAGAQVHRAGRGGVEQLALTLRIARRPQPPDQELHL